MLGTCKHFPEKFAENWLTIQVLLFETVKETSDHYLIQEFSLGY